MSTPRVTLYSCGPTVWNYAHIGNFRNFLFVDLLRRWLDECLYVHEVEGFACRSIEFAVFEAASSAGAEPLRLHAFLHGEPIDPTRHVARAVIRGIGAQGLSVQGESDGFRVRATLDL